MKTTLKNLVPKAVTTLLVFLFMFLLASQIQVQALAVGDFQYEIINSNEAKITGYYGSSGAVVVPDTLDGHQVTYIGDYAFREKDITSISLPDSVTVIGNYSFWCCTNLESITIPNNVTSIGTSAFMGCTALKRLTIPSSVATIGRSAFHSCSGLANLTISEGVDSIGEWAFYGCSSLTSITLPNGVTVERSAFGYCTGLTSITIPNSMTSIGDYVFSNCSSLESITLPSGVTSLGMGAFYGCSSLTDIALPDSIISIGRYAFRNCTSLASITIPDGITSIGGGAFMECGKLTNITIPNGVTTIANSMFYGCSSLASISIPSSVTSIEGFTFYDCNNLTSITLPDGVTSIGDRAFTNCSNLTGITLPNGVTSIGDGAFTNCSSLTNLAIPSSVTSIGPNVFLGCDQLTVSGLYVATFDSLGGSEVADIKYILNNSTIAKPSDPTKSNYNFVGWYTDNTYSTEWDFANDTVTENVTLYAKWDRIPSVGGNSRPKPITNVTIVIGEGTIETSAVINGETDNSGQTTVTVSHNVVSTLIGGVVNANDTGKSGVIEIKASTPSDIESISVGIPKGSFKEIAQLSDVQVMITTGIGTVKFDATSVKSISDQEGTGTITISLKKVNKKELSSEISHVVGDRPVYDLSVYAGNTMISDFGGGTATVSIPYDIRPDEDKNAIVVYYIDDSGKLQTMIGNYSEKDKAVVFKTSHFSNYLIGHNKVEFSDVKGGSWYSEPVSFISAREIAEGTGSNIFSPKRNLTRGQLIVMIMRAYNIAPDLSDSENYTDAGSTYYTGYLAAAKRLGITSGMGNNKFAPDREISRQDMFTILYRTLSELEQLPTTTGDHRISDYNDAGDVDDYAKEATKVFVEGGIIQGAEGRLNPNADLTRAEMAQILYKLLIK